MTTPTYKRCTRCKAIKAASEFYASHTAKDGLQTKCKACEREWAKERNIARPGYVVDEGGPRLPHRPQKLCKVCASLPHRVEGAKCTACGLEWMDS